MSEQLFDTPRRDPQRSYVSIAAQVAEQKKVRPDLYCRHRGCLWYTAKDPCEKPGHDRCPQCRMPLTQDHHEGCMYFS